MPPSANRLWRMGKRGPYSDKQYVKWQEECRALCLQFRWHKQPVRGPYQLWMTFNRGSQSGDLDNRTKGLIDILHRMGITDDDMHLERYVVDWGDAPVGCRVIVAPYDGEIK